jgi:hypothetical protein
MENYKSGSRSTFSSFFVLLALLFSIHHVQPTCTHTFNPLSYVQEHRIESVFQGPAHCLDAAFIFDVQAQATTQNHSSSTQITRSEGILTPDRLTKLNFQYTSPLFITNVPHIHSLVSTHIRFINHQSFSDDGPLPSFLI